MTNQDSRAKLLPWAIAAIVGLLGSNVYLWTKLGKKETKVEQLTVAVNDATSAKDSLDKIYNESIVQLEEMKGKNTELNSMIDQQKAELTAKKSKIEALLKDSKGFAAAKLELNSLKTQAAGYIAQIAELRQKNEQLTANVNTLTTEKTALEQTVTQKETEKQEVIAQKTAVEGEKAKVEEERTNLAKKVDAASAVKVLNFDQPKGYDVKESGKEVTRRKARNFERVKWCFDAVENAINKGKETFYIRIISPTGETISVASAGGGVIKGADGKEVPYTSVVTADLDGSTQKVCATWDPGVELQKGAYQMEVYNKGYLSGKTSFTFKR